MAHSSFWLVLLCTALYGALHSLLAAERVKSFFRTRLSRERFASYRLVYNLVAGVTLLPLAALVLLLPDRLLYRIPTPWVYLTLALQAFILLGALIAFRQSTPLDFLGIAQVRSQLGMEHPPFLVISGFYRYCRHPLYFFGLAFIWLFPVMTWNLLALFLGFTLYILLGSRLEEGRLIHEYGEAYRAYMRDVPWLIPNPFKRIKR